MPRGGARPGAGRKPKPRDASAPAKILTVEQLLRIRCRKYGLTVEDYFKLYDEQKGMCALCGKPGSYKGLVFDEMLSIDHDHGTTKIRGLIHPRCNCILGYAQDDIALLQKAIAYLRRTNPYQEQ